MEHIKHANRDESNEESQDINRDLVSSIRAKLDVISQFYEE